MSVSATNGQSKKVRNRTKTSDPTTGWVYFSSVNRNRIKIGWSTDPDIRHRQHSKGQLGEQILYEPLCEVRGTKADEGFIHDHFSDDAFGDEEEVFNPSQRLIDYIRWLRDMYYVVVHDGSGLARDEIPAIDPSHWLPDGRRQKPKPAWRQLDLTEPDTPFDLAGRETTGDDFYTNKAVIEAVTKVLGSIDLDPASHAVANQVVQASEFFTIADNGLQRPWNGKVWMNPPFSEWKLWAAKLLGELESKRVTEACVLAATRTLSAQYFSAVLRASHAHCIITGRLRFWGVKAGDSPDDGHAVFYFGDRREAFREVFSELGIVFFSSIQEQA